jgi:transcriptional regulator NrdR family protein
MKCPVCGTRHMEVLQTRREPNETIRIRQCFNEHKFETKESVTRVVPKGTGAHLRKTTMERMVAVHQGDWPGAEATEQTTT